MKIGRSELREAEDAFRGGNLTHAESLVRRCLRRNPLDSRANELLAYVLGRKGDLPGVYEHLVRATSAKGASASAWYYLGVWLRGEHRLREAADAFGNALAIQADFFEALHDLGCVLYDLGTPGPAIDAFDRAVALRPGSFEVFHNRGRAFQALHRHEDALADYERALALEPGRPETWVSRGEALGDLRRYDEALAAYETAQRRDPGNADAIWNEALLRLLLGQFEIGWPKYEFRWKGRNAWPRRHTGIAAWDATIPADGKTILVWWEQGFGDTLQFCRYGPMLAERGARVVLEVQPQLKPLLSCLGSCTVIAEGEDAPPCDYQVPLLSLPLAFGTTLETIPAQVPYLSPPPDRVSEWSGRVGRRDGRLKLAIACSGHQAQKDDRKRSMGLGHFAALREMADMFLVSPQLDEQNRLALGQLGGAVEHIGASVRDFADSAAIVANMDAVVTIDTSLAHLAGALGKPVWILLPWTPTWRWLVDRADSPWYPTARLIRQRSSGDWSQAMEQVQQALAREIQPCC